MTRRRGCRRWTFRRSTADSFLQRPSHAISAVASRGRRRARCAAARIFLHTINERIGESTMIAKRETIAAVRRSAGQHYVRIAVDKIEPHPDNPRATFDESGARSAGRVARQLGTVAARSRSTDCRRSLPSADGRTPLAGCTKLIGRKTIAAFVRHVDDQQAAHIVAEDNLQFVALNPMEKARAFALLTRSKEKGGAGMTHAQIAKRLKQDPSNVTNTLRLLKLPAEWQAARDGGGAGLSASPRAGELRRSAAGPRARGGRDRTRSRRVRIRPRRLILDWPPWRATPRCRPAAS
jgi:hypothetical protein